MADHPARDTSTKTQVPFRTALLYWLRLGFISFGGPAGQIAIMHAELVERKRWISERRFLHALNYCMLLPGPEAQQLATYIGWLLHGTWGGIVAGGLFVLPSLFILMALSWVYVVYGELAPVAAVFWGLKPAVVAVVVAAVLRVGSRAITSGGAVLLACAAFVALLLKVPFPLIVLSAGVLGVVGAKLWPNMFQLAAHAQPSHTAGAASIIDDHHVVPRHARPSKRRLALQFVVGLALWAAPIVALLLWQGPQGTLVQMGGFFTLSALVTFGGAYAVLPYVREFSLAAGWLKPGQMLDGLALGETTPGPLIMVVAFVGFVGGWQQADLGWPGAVLGCLIATYFTFLPSFLFILLGAPLVEKMRDQPRMTAALSGVTAAIVGIMSHLAVSFGLQVFLLPQDKDWLTQFTRAFTGAGPYEVPERASAAAVALAAAAFVALWRFKVGVVRVIIGCGLVGLITYWR